VQVSKVTFCFGIHNHQPVGNFGWVISDAVQRSYRPFLEVLRDFPAVRISLHFTGILLDWLEENDSALLDLVAQLVDRGQVELLTGAHFEPILPIIPDRDKLGQIARQTDFLQRRFGVKARGMWLAERVWEPQLPGVLRRAGIEYSILDDIHFLYAGLRTEQLTGYYLTEDQGETVALFPISQRLRYTIPFADPEKTIEELRRIADSGENQIAIYADDGEKFGVWPETDKLCFEERWLARFFQQLTDNRDWIEMKHFGEVLDQHAPRGRVYLPTASYSEMNQWALPAESINELESFAAELKEQKRFDRLRAYVKGGYWRNFLTKYSESNHLHKRMLYVSRLLDQVEAEKPRADLSEARRHLHAGQCNCPYWHGVFGGLYLPHLRGAIYQELIAAEKSIRQLVPGGPLPLVEQYDFDCDGHDELLVTTENTKFFFAPHEGGALLELDDFSQSKNLIDIVGRRREAYHQQLLDPPTPVEGTKSIHERVVAKEEGLEKLLTEDWYRHGCLIDHFLGDAVTAEQFAAAQYEELGDFVNQSYHSEYKRHKNGLTTMLQREGLVWHEQQQHPLLLQKTLNFATGQDRTRISYEITNRGEHALSLRFGIEFAFGTFIFTPEQSMLKTGKTELPTTVIQDSRRKAEDFTLHSGLYDYDVAVGFDKQAGLWSMPLYTVSLSEAGFEKVQQGLLLLPHWRLQLEPGQCWKLELQLVPGSDRQELTSPSTASGQARR
jgi:alpha-amylase